jgi:hypothetical protein
MVECEILIEFSLLNNPSARFFLNDLFIEGVLADAHKREVGEN